MAKSRQMAKSRRKNNHDRGLQTRRKLSFYEEIADPDYKWENKENSGRQRRSDNNKSRTRSGVSTKATNSNVSKKYTEESMLGRRKNAGVASSKPGLRPLTKFYIIACTFMAVCILFTIMMYSCKSSVDSQTNNINNQTSDLEKTFGENETTYSYIFNTNIEKALIKEAVPQAIDFVSEMGSSKKIVVTGDKQPSSSTLSQLENEVSRIVNDDEVYLSFCLIDVLSKKSIYYYIDYKAPTFSCIKAPYTCACVSQDSDLLEKYDEGLYQAIKFSENYPYETMWSQVGLGYLYNWCKELNIGDSLENIEYPMHFSVRSMTKFWLKIFEQFNTNEEIATYVSYYTHTKNSAIDTALGDDYLVQSKAGWGDGTIDYTGYNDCGIVNVDKHPYVLCIFSGYNCDSDALVKLVRCLDNCHSEMIAN